MSNHASAVHPAWSQSPCIILPNQRTWASGWRAAEVAIVHKEVNRDDCGLAKLNLPTRLNVGYWWLSPTEHSSINAKSASLYTMVVSRKKALQIVSCRPTYINKQINRTDNIQYMLYSAFFELTLQSFKQYTFGKCRKTVQFTSCPRYNLWFK